MTAPIEASSHGLRPELDGHWPYEQFVAAGTAPAFGTSAAAAITASMARPSEIGTMRRRGYCDMRTNCRTRQRSDASGSM